MLGDTRVETRTENERELSILEVRSERELRLLSEFKRPRSLAENALAISSLPEQPSMMEVLEELPLLDLEMLRTTFQKSLCLDLGKRSN